MIRGIHYFSAELKTKIDVIPRGCLTICGEKWREAMIYYYQEDII